MSFKIETTQPNNSTVFDLLKNQPAEQPTELTLPFDPENSSGRAGEFNQQASQLKFTLLSGNPTDQARLTNVATVSSAAPVAEGKSEVSYDGMFVGANGRAYTDNTPLNQIPAVMPAKGATMHRVIYVNGIVTDKKTQFDNMQVIANATGAPVIGIHNSTEGFAKDIKQCVLDKKNIGKNAAHDTLTQTIVSELRQGHSLHIMAHSQGGLITARSLNWAKKILFNEEIKKTGGQFNPMSRRRANAEVERMMGKIQVETFGAASTAYTNGPRYVHYINNADNTPTKLGLGEQTDANVAGKNAVVKHFRADFPGKKIFGTIPDYTKVNDTFNAPHSIDNCYMSYRIPFAQAWKEGSGFMTSPVRPFPRAGYEIHETP